MPRSGNMNKLFKFTVILMAVVSSGLIMPINAMIPNNQFRHILIEWFIFPTHWVYNLPGWRFSTSKDSVLFHSNCFLAPIALFVSALAWSILATILLKLRKTEEPKADFSRWSSFWMLCFWSIATISVAEFISWWLLNDATLGGYESSPLSSSIQIIWFVVALPNTPSTLLAAAVLDNGFDTLHGYEDTIAVSKTVSAFGVVVWSVLIALIVTRLRAKICEV